MALVSALIPCFNAERWIAQAIESALAQSWPEMEVIVVDDGSTDGSLEVIKTFGARIRWQSGSNQGGNIARNRLLELARGEWLQYLDADDYLLPDKILKQMQFLSENSKADLIFGPVTLEHWNEGSATRELLCISEPRDPWILLARWYLPQTGASLWRKQALLDVGGWKPDQPCCQEHELYLRLMMAEKSFAYCDHNGAIYRHWGEETLWRKDLPQVHRRRLEIEQRAEDFLRATNRLTPDRLWAINQARFEIARMAWLYDPTLAMEIMETVGDSQADFLPAGDAAPAPYPTIYRWLGFRWAQHLADIKRSWLSGNAKQKTRESS